MLRKIFDAVDRKKKSRYLDGLIRKGLKLGRNVGIVGDFFFDPSHCYLIAIGDNCTICPNVRLIAHNASTKKILGYTKLGKIEIMENCFIGDSAIILPAVKIGPNSIIGAGSVVTRDIPANAVAAGNPAKVMGSVEDYIRKIESLSRDKEIFNEAYSIDNLDEKKRREIIKTVGESMGFIV